MSLGPDPRGLVPYTKGEKGTQRHMGTWGEHHVTMKAEIRVL